MNTVDHAGVRHRLVGRTALTPVGLWLLSLALAALAAACGSSDDAREAPSTGGAETTAPTEVSSSDIEPRFNVSPEACESPRWALRSEEEALALYSDACLQLEECPEDAHVSFILDPHSLGCLHPDDPDLNPPAPRPPSQEPCEDEEHIQEVREARACLLYHLAELGHVDVEIYARSIDFTLPYHPDCDTAVAVAVARHPAVSAFGVCHPIEAAPPE